MANTFFKFKEFRVEQDQAAMKVTTDACLFGAWVADQLPAVKRILDIGTGTGLLSLMMAQKSMAEIDAIEIDEGAYLQAKDNFEASPWSDRLHVVHADVRIWKGKDEYDAIVTNPPFYGDDLASPKGARSVAHHGDGLLLSDLVQVLSLDLSPGGEVFILFPYRRKEELLDALGEISLYVMHVTTVRQSILHEPMRVMVRAGRKVPAATTEDECIIRDDEARYSGEFCRLLDPYYLNVSAK